MENNPPSNIQTDSDQKQLIGETDEVFGELNLLTKSLHELDDRGLILSLSAFAEDALGSLLRAFMLPSEATSQLLEGFNAPLGTLSARIKGAYSLGLITKNQFLDLERLRKIRNEFAHTWRPIDISKPKVASLIKEMNYSRIDNRFPETPSEKIRSSISCLLVELRSATHQIKNQGAEVQLTGRQLMCGFTGNFQEQLQGANNELGNILQHLESVSGEKRNFYLTLLKSFTSRLSVLAKPKTVDQCQEVSILLDKLKHALEQHSA